MYVQLTCTYICICLYTLDLSLFNVCFYIHIIIPTADMYLQYILVCITMVIIGNYSVYCVGLRRCVLLLLCLVVWCGPYTYT